MEPMRALTDDLFRGEIARAREMSPEEKMRLAGELFDDVCERMRDGIRFQHPDADEARVEELLEERLQLARRLGAA